MVTLIHASEDGDIFAVSTEIHAEGRDDATVGVDGIVVGRKNTAGRWAFEFQGPESLDSLQRQACIEAADVFCAERDKPTPEAAPSPTVSAQLQRTCPLCAALPGEPCTTSGGNPAPKSHADR